MTTRKKVAFIFATVLTALALLAMFFTVLLAVEFFTAAPPETNDAGANFGYGLGKAIALLLMIYTVLGTVLFSIPGGIVSFVNRKVEHKTFRGLFIGYSAANLLFLIGSVLSLVGAIMLG